MGSEWSAVLIHLRVDADVIGLWAQIEKAVYDGLGSKEGDRSQENQ